MQFHPDKNQAPGADEAFKSLSRAFAILGDPEKRRQYDRFGHAETSGSFGGSGSADINPEDLFRAFFGGGAGGGANPFFFHHEFSAGPGGFFSNIFEQHPQFRTARQRRPQQPQPRRNHTEHQHPLSEFERLRLLVRQMLPLIIFFAIALLSSWFGGSDTASSSNTVIKSFEEIADLVTIHPEPGYPNSRQTSNYHVQYWATRSFEAHFSDLSSSYRKKRDLAQYEAAIERYWVRELQRKCRVESADLNERIRLAKGDKEELARLKSEENPSCKKLHSLGLKLQ